MLASTPQVYSATCVTSWQSAVGGWEVSWVRWGSLQNEVQEPMEPEASPLRPLLTPRSHSSPSAVSTTPSPHQWRWQDQEQVFTACCPSSAGLPLRSSPLSHSSF